MVLSSEDKRLQVERILAYPGFQASERRKAMLRFVVEETLAGRSGELKGPTIAVEVFGRKADFDPQSDPVVRLEARKLRRDLDNYYVGAGRNDPVRIEMPKGAYVPIFTAQKPIATDDEPAAAEAAPVYTAVPTETDSIPSPRARGNRTSRTVIAAAVVGAIGFTIAERLVPDDVLQEALGASSDTARITVAGFATPAQDDFSSLLAAGLSHDISAALLKFPDLRVHLASASATTENAAAAVGPPRPETHFTVSGIVSRDDENVTVRSELRRNADSEVLWTEIFSIQASEHGLSGISNEISARIATVVGQQYGVARSEIREQLLADTSDPGLKSYACIARATIYRRTLDPDQYPETRQCLEQTVLREPDYARGWAMLAYLRNDGYRYGYDPELSQDEALSRARDAAGHALTLDPHDTDALKALSHIEHYAGHLDRSIDYAQKAVATNPHDPETIGNLGIMLGFQGRFAEATPFLERAIERSISPAPRYFQFLAMAHMMNEDWEEMLAASSRAVADGSGFSFFLAAISNAALGNQRAAQENLRKSEELWPELVQHPKVALDVHNVEPALVDAFVAGLSRVRALDPG